MKRLASVFLMFFAVAFPAEAGATDQSAIAIEGTYFLIQDDGFQRIISLDRGGAVSRVSDQQTVIGFTGGAGAWKEIAPGKAKATVIDFDFDQESGERLGTALTIYELTFGDPNNGRYRKVAGKYTGNQYAVGQNPLDPSGSPVRTFGVAFTGQRISVD